MATVLILCACVWRPEARTGADETAGRQWSSPFAYCTAVGTIDRPDQRYVGPRPAPGVVRGLANALGASPTGPGSETFRVATYWRCMNGEVYACNVGANLPCWAKANTSRSPGSGERDYCQEKRDTQFIPLYVTGHNSVYEWGCEQGKPVIVKMSDRVDARGYLANLWYRIPPPNRATP